MSNISEINGLNITAATASFVPASAISGAVTSASYAATASLAPNYVLNSTTSSMLSPYVLTSQTSSMSVSTASLALRASGSLTGSLLGTASYYQETDPIFIARSASLATTGSNTFVGNQVVSGSYIIDVSSSVEALRVTQRGSGNAILVEDSANPDSTPFVVDASGNVGIGTASPQYSFVASSSTSSDVVMFFDGGASANSNLVSRADTSIKVPSLVISDRSNAYSVVSSFYIGLDRNPSSLFANRNDAIYVNNYTDKGHYFVTANSSGTKAVRMVISGSGNVGIGTATPNTTLHISASSAQPLLNIENATANGYSNMRFTGTGKKFVIGVGNASETTFGIANDFFIYDDSVGAVRAVMDTNGNIGVGTVSPGALLHVNGTGIIATSLAVGTSSLGSTENALVVGLPPAGGAGEGGQILLQASGGLYTTASMIDNYQNKFRILRGTNASSDAFKMQLDMHTGQMQLPNYNSQTAFTGTPVASLSVDSSGNILTVSSSVSVIHNKIGATFAGAASPTTRYHTVAGAIDTSNVSQQVPFPVACTVNNFYFRTYGAQPAGGSLVLTLQKNGADTAITVTVAAGSAAGNFTDTTNSVAFVAGDTWQLKLVQNALTGTSTGIAGYSFKSTS